jgi:hypothetical protein
MAIWKFQIPLHDVGSVDWADNLPFQFFEGLVFEEGRILLTDFRYGLGRECK